MFGQCKSMTGEAFVLQDCVEIRNPGIIALGSEEQLISPTRSIRKGQVWFGPQKAVGGEMLADNISLFQFKIAKIVKTGEGIQELWVEHYLEDTAKKVSDENAAYKQLILDLDLHQEKLRGIIKQMLVNCFKEGTLKELLAADRIEFIIDDLWLYLRCGEKAFRV